MDLKKKLPIPDALTILLRALSKLIMKQIVIFSNVNNKSKDENRGGYH